MIMTKYNKTGIIINADDLGISFDVNRKIEECINRGVVTSTSLLVNAPAFEDGVRIAKQYSNVSTGVHLNLIEFSPLTNDDVFKKFGIVGPDGNFIEGAVFVADCNDKQLQQAIFEEWDAQICRFKATGIVPTHIDSHEHTHAIASLQDVLCKVMDKHGIKRVRRKMIPSIRLMIKMRKHPDSVKLDKSMAVTPIKHNVFYRRIRLFIEKYQSARWNRQMSKRYLMTDSFYAFRFFYSSGNIIHLGRKVELMCHPGHMCYQLETDSLLNDINWKKNIYLTSYNDI